jgi:hypothetical protein
VRNEWAGETAGDLVAGEMVESAWREEICACF